MISMRQNVEVVTDLKTPSSLAFSLPYPHFLFLFLPSWGQFMRQETLEIKVLRYWRKFLSETLFKHFESLNGQSHPTCFTPA
jgi:hypothetical protein